MICMTPISFLEMLELHLTCLCENFFLNLWEPFLCVDFSSILLVSLLPQFLSLTFSHKLIDALIKFFFSLFNRQERMIKFYAEKNVSCWKYFYAPEVFKRRSPNLLPKKWEVSIFSMGFIAAYISQSNNTHQTGKSKEDDPWRGDKTIDNPHSKIFKSLFLSSALSCKKLSSVICLNGGKKVHTLKGTSVISVNRHVGGIFD